MPTTRVRTRNTTVRGIATAQTPAATVQYLQSNYYGAVETISDNNNHFFKRRKRAGEVIMSDMSLSRTETISIPGNIHRSYEPRIVYGDLKALIGIYGTPVNPSPADLRVESVAYLLTKAYAGMNSSNMMIGEFVHDLGQTVSMLRRPFKGIVDLLWKVQRATRRNLKNQVRTARWHALQTSKAWLEYRYGLKPLMMDVESIIAASQEIVAGSTRRLVSRAGDSNSETQSHSWPPTYQGDGTTSSSGTRSVTNEVKNGAGVLYEIKLYSSAETMNKVLGSRPHDFASTLWEVLPWSFVVDWAVNVGDWIRAVTPSPGITPLGNWQTSIVSTSEKVQALCEWSDGLVPSPLQFEGDFGGFENKTFSMTRLCNQPLPSYPVARYNGLSWQHQVDAVALLYTAVRGGLESVRH